MREQKLIQSYRVIYSDRGMSQCELPDSIIFSKNLNKQMSKLISFVGKCILASGLQKHAIYAPAFKSFKATQKHRADAFSFA